MLITVGRPGRAYHVGAATAQEGWFRLGVADHTRVYVHGAAAAFRRGSILFLFPLLFIGLIIFAAVVFWSTVGSRRPRGPGGPGGYNGWRGRGAGRELVNVLPGGFALTCELWYERTWANRSTSRISAKKSSPRRHSVMGFLFHIPALT